MDYQSLIIQLVTGAIGGGTIATLIKSVGMGNIANLVVGAIGGAASGPLIGMISGAGIGALVGDNAVAGAVLYQALAGGGVLTGVAGFLKNMMGKQKLVFERTFELYYFDNSARFNGADSNSPGF